MNIFGEIQSFALECETPANVRPLKQPNICCHMIVGARVVGDPNDIELVGLYEGDLKRMLDRVLHLRAVGHDFSIDGLSDREVVELVLKANQLEDEFDPKFIHLPQLESKFWYTHQLFLATTTDQDFVGVFNSRNNIKLFHFNFNTPQTEVHTVICDFATVIAAIEGCIKFLKESFPVRITW
jgi:hypothetical protein